MLLLSCASLVVSLVYMNYIGDEEFPLPFIVLLAALRIIDMRQINSRKSNVVSYIKGLHADMKFQREAT